jgi:hypothetical protein
LAENGRNGERIVFRSETHWAMTSRIVPSRSRSPVLGELPRLGVGDVLVDLRDDPHRLADRLLLPVPADQVAHRVERGLDVVEQGLVLGGERTRGRDLAEVLGDQVGRPVHQVAPSPRRARRSCAARTPPR